MKPCPFCGSDRITMGYMGQPGILIFITCSGCGAQGPSVGSNSASGGSFDGDKALKLWNKRLPLP